MAPSYTARQGQYLAYIHRFTTRHSVAPSFEEIAAHFGTSSPSVNGMIKTLEGRGFLSRVPGVARSLRVLVPTTDLPESDFGAGRAPRGGLGSPTGGSIEDAGAAAATAVLDVLLPRLALGQDADRWVLEAAAAVRASLAAIGLSNEQTQRVAARVAAEAARWQPGGRGTFVRRRRWVR